ncbi:PQQ-binding-like beta-propeller repeat protein [Shewanella electrodiphila]|uniref:PQQ-binding-like beta-propeller repeat protein n=1 Tax=Shewanella electrodiphila TaxID=934143 RepID=A0ABT0KRL1_9GAMM|nr:PQQ-binding-like beta-propeller repeat protein [Shewanella electrodiphila]MCL1046151.1 PQQ-binding-like beta-propeller repeat protein [Shewanella electrodiphila]
MELRKTNTQLVLLALLTTLSSGCDDNAESTPKNTLEAINYGPLNNSVAIKPTTEEIALKDRLLVNGNTAALVTALDLSSHVPDSGIAPALYSLANNTSEKAITNQWKPSDIPTHIETINSESKGFYTLHSDTRNSDEVMSVTPPEMMMEWIADRNIISLEGGVFDQNSNIYTVPLDPVDDIYLVSINPDTGARRWHLPNKRIGQGGSPLILPSIKDDSNDIIYIGSYEYITAVDTQGNVIWDVETGLKAPENAQEFDVHNFGLNYHANTNSVIALYADGHMVAHDRDTGRAIMAPFSLPGSPATATDFKADYSKLTPLVENGLSKVFANSETFFGGLNIILGGGHEVANYFGIDNNTGRLFVAGTAPDEVDGHTDELSSYGALYAIDLTQIDGEANMSILWRKDFEGGTAATPTISFDGQRIYTADSVDNILAIDANSGELIWDFSTGSGQVIGSIAVSREGNEIYASTGTNIIKVLDMDVCAGDGFECNQAIWLADMESAYQSEVLQQSTPQAHIYTNVLKPAIEGFFRSGGNTEFNFEHKAGNMVLAGITANGITAQIGYGYISPLGKVLPFQISQVLFERETGKIRYIAPGVEESISVMAQAPNGNLYMSNSPLRRILNIGILRAVGVNAANDALKYFGMDILGGIAKYSQQPNQSIHYAKESAETLLNRITNLIDKLSGLSDEVINAEIARLAVPTTQFEMNLIKANNNGEINQAELDLGLMTHSIATVNNMTELKAAEEALQTWLAH